LPVGHIADTGIAARPNIEASSAGMDDAVKLTLARSGIIPTRLGDGFEQARSPPRIERLGHRLQRAQVLVG
jgi:hypothetical protein